MIKIRNKNETLKFFNKIYRTIAYNYNFAGFSQILKSLLIKQKQILFFIIAGAMSAVVEVLTFKLFSVTLTQLFSWEKNIFGLHFPLSNVLSTVCGIISNYFFSIWFVFERGKHSKKREFAYFMVISFLSTLISLVFFQIFYTTIFRNEYFDLGFFVFSSEMLSKISAIVTVSGFNYILKKKVIFSG